MRKILTTLNSKFIHSSYALYVVKASFPEWADAEIREYTINQRAEDITADIFAQKPDVIGFSCYIWNILMIREIAAALRLVLPGTRIVFGGPEVRFDPESYAGLCDEVCVRDADFPAPFAYSSLEPFENRIIYYETQKGCPYGCRYCLSGGVKGLSFLGIERAKQELRFFLDSKVRQVKFVDRTFNCNKNHSAEIWRFLTESDNGSTNFHFEIAGDLLDGDTLDLLSKARQGLFQFEIGVQSADEATLEAIGRRTNLEKIKLAVNRLRKDNRINIHLDLIAGLPGESYESFGKSFDFVYSMRPEQLQLGFLKLLKGSYLRENAGELGIVYNPAPPYEVLFTKELNFDELLRLKRTESMVEKFYNSNSLIFTLDWLDDKIKSPFEFFSGLAEHYYSGNFVPPPRNKAAVYREFYGYCLDAGLGIDAHILAEHMKFDLLLNENLPELPEFMFAADSGEKHDFRRFYEKYRSKYLPGMDGLDLKHIARRTRIERFELEKGRAEYFLFDYSRSMNNKGLRSFHAAFFDITACIKEVREE